YKKTYESKNGDKIRVGKAFKTALKGLDDAESHLHKQNFEAFYLEVHNLLNKLYVDRYGVDLIEHPLDSLVEELDCLGKERTLLIELTEKVQMLNYFRYSSTTAMTTEELINFLASLKDNITGISNATKKD
ncbi:hypothetical protein ACFL2A_06495, partial [Thermodesulfobacteriota bacterium]